MGRKRETSGARQRILETADRLFYQGGVRAVGIDRIIAEAGVAKMSLYKHFPSKDDLILAVLQYREQGVLEFFRSAMERHGKKAKTPLRAFFAALKDFFESPGFRGCPFQNAAVELADPEHPGTEIAGQFEIGRLYRLNSDDIQFVETFIKNRGNAYRVADELKIPYSAVRARLSDIIRALGFEVEVEAEPKEEPAVSPERRKQILEDLQKGKLSSEAAIKLLQGEG